MLLLLSGLIFSENTAPSNNWPEPLPKKGQNSKPSVSDKYAKALIDLCHFRLDNGLDVVFIPNPTSPIVSVGVLYRYGSADDVIETYGIAHFLEHMMFKGTKRYPKGHLHNIILCIGGWHNGYTSWDSTFYEVSAPQNALEMLLELEADRMVNLAFEDKEVVPEKNVVKEEETLRIKNNLFGEAYKVGLRTMFTEHPYGIHAIGNPQHIEAYNSQNTRAAYKKWYAPNNAMLIISGNFEKDQIKAMVKNAFGSLKPSSKIPKQRIRQKEPKFEGISRYIVQENQKSTMVIAQMVYPNVCLRESSHVNVMAHHIAAFILGGNNVSLLYKELVRNKQMVTHVSAHNMIGLDPMFIDVRFKLRPNLSLKAALAHFKSFMRNLVDQDMYQPWFEARFQEVKSQLKARITFAVDGTRGVLWFFKDCDIGFTPEQLNSVLQVIDQVPLEAVRSVIKKMSDKPRGMLIIHPPEYKVDLFV